MDLVAANVELRAPMEQVTPMRRPGNPCDIATATVYLTSPASIYLTGMIWKSMVTSLARILT
ncbi:hypothetical protein A8144_11825 [Mycobacterium leprae 3125609]|nr:hypothetical protein A8144_11825 [Mycobacterium leprae 3125609]OAX70561.1 hypothetical protein A3216_11280 [Mycobacterium leprae 7935681]